MKTPNEVLNLDTTPGAPMPGLPVDSPFANLFVLYFRWGSNPHTQSKYFRHEGSFQDSIARGRRHCELTNLRFIKVEKFLSDFAEDERIHST